VPAASHWNGRRRLPESGFRRLRRRLDRFRSIDGLLPDRLIRTRCGQIAARSLLREFEDRDALEQFIKAGLQLPVFA